MIRSLAPTLALVACATALTAADQSLLKPELSFGGFVDAWANAGDDHTADDPATSWNENGVYARFHAIGAVHSDVRFTDQVGGRLDLWLSPRDQSFTTSTRVYVRDANIHWGDDTWTATVGKQIRPLGWVSPDPASWYRVLPSTIGYVADEPIRLQENVFGNDVIGGSLAWHRHDVPVRVTGFLNNGFFSPGDSSSDDAVTSGRQRDGLGYGFDIGYVPDERATVDLAVAFDPRTSSFTGYNFGMHDGRGVPSDVGNRGLLFRDAAPGGTDAGGNALLIDLNSTIKPMRPLTLGAEIARFSIGNSRGPAGSVGDTDYKRWQGLVMANWAFDHASFPISVTGEIQHIRARNGDGTNGRAWEYTAAVLTRPFARIPLHLDGELSYANMQSTQSGGDSSGWQIAGRALLTF